MSSGNTKWQLFFSLYEKMDKNKLNPGIEGNLSSSCCDFFLILNLRLCKSELIKSIALELIMLRRVLLAIVVPSLEPSWQVARG